LQSFGRSKKYRRGVDGLIILTRCEELVVLLGAGGVHKLATIVVEAAKVSPKEKKKSSDQKG